MIDHRMKDKPMENVYRAIMPITGSTSRMGVTITASRGGKTTTKTAGKRGLNQQSLVLNSSASRGSAEAVGKNASEDIGRTYMNSFMNQSRYARQSPRKVQDAENAFLKKKNGKNSVEASLLGMRQTSSVMQESLRKAKKGEEQMRQAYKTMTHIAKITSGTTSLVSSVSP